MSTHTPGPWVYDEGIVYPQEDHAGQAWIADIRGAVDADANARLIAAAPDLLQALKDILHTLEQEQDVYDGADGTPRANEAMRYLAEHGDAIRAAIAKAEGKP